LLIVHHESHQLTLVDTISWQIIHQLEVVGRTALLEVSSSNRYGFAVHRDDHCVTLFDSTTSQLQTIATEQQPTHFHAHTQVTFGKELGNKVY
jgi:hypothetical protein